MFILIVQQQVIDVDRIILITINVEEVQQKVVTLIVYLDHWLIMLNSKSDVAKNNSSKDEKKNKEYIPNKILHLWKFLSFDSN